jgi:hypothetical protein
LGKKKRKKETNNQIENEKDRQARENRTGIFYNIPAAWAGPS